MRKKFSGFTLMELMVVMALAGVLLAVAVPNFREFIRNSRLTSAANDLIVSISSARTEAVKRQLPVAVCATATPNATPPVCNGGAYNAWVVWVDANNNWTPDNDVAEEVLSRHPLLNASLTVKVNDAETGIIKFQPTGFAAPPAGGFNPTTNVVICDERGLDVGNAAGLAGRALLVTATGRARVTRDPVEIQASMTAMGFGMNQCP